MATMNPFDLLGDNDSDDPSQMIIAAKKHPQQQQQKPAPKKPQVAAAPASQPKLPSKPLPPAQAVREARNDFGAGRGGGRSGGRGAGRGRGSGTGFNRDYGNNENVLSDGVSGGYGGAEDGESGRPSERGRGSYGGRGPFRGGRRGGFSNGEEGDGEHPRRLYDRRSGTGRGNVIKREGSGRGNWGTATDELVQENEDVNVIEKNPVSEVHPGEEDAAAANKESPVKELEEKEHEEKEMTLDEYEKVLEEKRKALLALKVVERKVDDKEFQSMQQLNKKSSDEIFIKLGSEKDKRKDIADKEEKAKKAVSINEFLKPAEGSRYYGGRGRGRGDRSRGGFAGGNVSTVAAPSIEDPGQFPTLGAK